MKKSILLPSFFFAGLAILWQVLASFGWIDAQLLPSPMQILNSLMVERASFTQAFRESFLNSFFGWGVSLLVGSTLALLFSLSTNLRRAIYPFAIFFQTVPIIAIAPLLVIYFGFGAPAVVASAFIVSLFPVLANTLMGLESFSGAQLDLFRVYKASSWQILIKLKIPSAFSQWFAGLKISAGLAVIGTVAGEFVAGGGLGAMIDAGRTQQRIDLVFAALALLSLMALVFFLGLEFLKFVALRTRPFVENSLRLEER